MIDTIVMHIYEPIAKVMLKIDVEKPTLIAMLTTKVIADRSDFGQISRRSVITGQLVLNRSIALEQDALRRVEAALEKEIAGIELSPKKPRAPWSEVVHNDRNQRTALHRNLKDNSKLYIALDTMRSYTAPVFFSDQGEVLTKEQVMPFLKASSSGGEIADYNYQLHGTDSIGSFAMCLAPETLEEKQACLKELIAALEKVGAK